MRESTVCRSLAKGSNGPRRRVMVAGFVLCLAALPLVAADEATVQGSLIANGEAIELPYVYLWAEEEGFYDSADPTWKLLFTEQPVETRKLGRAIWDGAWVEIGLTETSEFDGEPKLQVYSQSIKLSADSGGNVSGGTYPEIEIDGIGSDRVSGRVYHPEPQEFFDDTYQYDFTFSVPLSDPDAPIGDVLPAGGGGPGSAYLEWVEAVHSGDVKRLQSVVPAEMAAQLAAASPEDIEEQIEFLQMTTPSEVKILGGSTDGETAILQAAGMMDGESMEFEVTLIKMGDFWIATEVSM